MKEFSSTRSAIYIKAVAILAVIALALTLVFITHPVIAVIGFSTIIEILFLGSICFRMNDSKNMQK